MRYTVNTIFPTLAIFHSDATATKIVSNIFSPSGVDLIGIPLLSDGDGTLHGQPKASALMA